MDKLISIILPTYNGSKWVKKAIESVQSQTYTNWELLVIDDGSMDNTAQITIDIAKVDHRIIYIKNEQNLGIQKTLNKGIKEAKGEHIARIDDDDEWAYKDKLKDQIEFLENHTDHVLIGTGVQAVSESGKIIFERVNPISDGQIRNIILNKNCFIHSSVMFRKLIAIQVGGYNEDLKSKHVEDYDLWLRMGKIGSFANLPIIGVKLLIHSSSLSYNNKVTQFVKSIKLAKIYKNDYPNFYSAYISLYIRMIVYKILNLPIVRSAYPFLYKIYNNL